MSKILELKKKMNKKRPAFKRYEAHKHIKLKDAWRRPRGMHNKMKKNIVAKPAMVHVGYRTPAEVRHVNVRTGLINFVVACINDFNKLDSKIHAAIISSTVGMRKKIALINHAKSRGIHIANIRKPEEYEAKAKQIVENRKKRSETVRKTREAKAKAASEVKAKKTEQPKTEEEQKEEAKKNLDKILTKKE